MSKIPLEGRIAKPVDDGHEENFYTHLLHDDLREFVPRYYGKSESGRVGVIMKLNRFACTALRHNRRARTAIHCGMSHFCFLSQVQEMSNLWGLSPKQLRFLM